MLPVHVHGGSGASATGGGAASAAAAIAAIAAAIAPDVATGLVATGLVATGLATGPATAVYRPFATAVFFCTGIAFWYHTFLISS